MSVFPFDQRGYRTLLCCGICSTEGVPGTDGGLPAYYKLYSYGPAELACFIGAGLYASCQLLLLLIYYCRFFKSKNTLGVTKHTQTHRQHSEMDLHTPAAIDAWKTLCFFSCSLTKGKIVISFLLHFICSASMQLQLLYNYNYLINYK